MLRRLKTWWRGTPYPVDAIGCSELTPLAFATMEDLHREICSRGHCAIVFTVDCKTGLSASSWHGHPEMLVRAVNTLGASLAEQLARRGQQ